jgi:tetratricopeptide (TPR) repeat protein
MERTREQEQPKPGADALARARRFEAATLWADAARAYESALSLLTQDPESVEEPALLTALGRCYWFDGQARAAWRTLRRAIAVCEERADAVGQAQATVELLRIWGPPERQRAMADAALAALGEREPHLRALLYLRTRRTEEALRIGERHRFEDVLEVRVQEAAWAALEHGDAEEFVALLRRAHATYDRLGEYDIAGGQLRGGAFALLQLGRLSAGVALGEEARAYASAHHLRFTEQLVVMDLVGPSFARCEFGHCEGLLSETPAEADFRGDLYRMWIAQHHDQIDVAMRLIVDPDRAGSTPTAVSQIQAAAAGIFYAADEHDAATRALGAWAEVARSWESFAEEAPVPLDCLIALGSDALVREVRDAIAAWDARRSLPDRYATLQGRGLDFVRGALDLRLGDPRAAIARFQEGIEWAERERCVVEAGRCFVGLGDAHARTGDAEEAGSAYRRAAAVFEHAGAAYELRRLRARMGST